MNDSITSVIKMLTLSFLVIGAIYFGKVFFMPLCFSGILVTLLLPLCNWLENKGLPKVLAVISCLLTILIGIGGLVSFLGWKISNLMNDAEKIKSGAIEIGTKFQEYIFSQFGLSAADQMLILKEEQPSYSNLLENMAGSLSSILTNLIFIIIYFVFLLYYRGHIKQFLLKISPKNRRLEIENIIKNSTQVSQQYLIGLSKMIFLLWIMYGIGFSVIGVKNPVFFAILCGFLEVVPYLGNIFGTFITIFVAAIQGGEPSLLIGIGVVYAIVQTIQGWLLEPLILGPQVKINPLFTIIVLILGQLLWGIPGIILAIPITAIIKIVCDNVESLKPYGFLIGEIISTKKKIGFFKKLLNSKK
jgi:predicted PurR-regulated permease PerM